MSRWVEDRIIGEAKRLFPTLLRDLGRTHLTNIIPELLFIKKGKHRRDGYTKDDVAAERFLRDHLHRYFPDVGFLGEELRPKHGSPTSSSDQAMMSDALGGTYWVVDSLDGSLNYERGNPHFGIAIALVHRQEVLYGCILDSRRGEYFEAVKNEGVTLNGQRLMMLGQVSMEDSMIALGLGYDDRRADLILSVIGQLRRRLRGIRMTGCASLDLAYVAAGRFSCFVHPYLQAWDRLAGELMVREVGGKIGELHFDDRDPAKALVVGSPSIASEVFRLVEAEMRIGVHGLDSSGKQPTTRQARPLERHSPT